MSYFKIGYRNLARRKFRTILTIVAILLGVSILMGTSVASDSIRYSLNQQVTKQFGYSDIVIVDDDSPNSNSLPLNLMRSELDSISEIEFQWTFQMRERRSVTPYENTTTLMARWWQIIGLNASSPLENKFGSIIINSTINETLHTLEEILANPKIENSCVITKHIAERYNLTIGNSLYIYPKNPWPGIDWKNSSTWINLTITGIIEDKGKSFEWLSPPITNLWEIYPPTDAIYVNSNIAQRYIFNSNTTEVNLILIHTPNINVIDSTIEVLLNKLNSSQYSEINSTDFYAFNLKSFFDDQINEMFTFFTIILALFSGISMLICSILIKNLFEVTKEEQIEEIGIMRAIGISKFGIFKIYTTQIFLISIIGSLLGILFGYLVSYLFLGPLKILTISLAPNITPLVGSEFEVYLVISPPSWIFSLSVGISVSMVFGMIPAISAANVNVLKALNPRLMEED